jgi:hypothetical protein
MTIQLTQKYIDLLSSLPETGMGFQVVDVFLNNGEILSEIIVLNATHMRLPDNLQISSEEIIDIKLSNKS